MPHRVIGLRLTESKLAALGVTVEDAVESTLTILAHKVAEDAKANLSGHRTSGGNVHLADDIKVGEVEKKGHHYSIKIGPSKKTGWRARFLEWGTVHMGAIPFLRPARSKNRRLVKDTIRLRAAAATRKAKLG